MLHPENPIKNLTFKQLKNIYIGDIDNWKSVGGIDTLICLLQEIQIQVLIFISKITF